jgi:hypothetical protein
MNKIALLFFFLLTFGSMAHADQYQFLKRNGNETYYVSYSKVLVYNTNNEETFVGYTDKYGRISINLPQGNYSNSRVWYRERWWSVRLVVDNSAELKKTYLID